MPGGTDSSDTDSDGEVIDTTDKGCDTDINSKDQKLIVRIPRNLTSPKIPVKEETTRILLCTFLELHGRSVCCRCHVLRSGDDPNVECSGPCLGSLDKAYDCGCFGIPGPNDSDLSSQFHPLPPKKDDAKLNLQKKINAEQTKKMKLVETEQKKVRAIAKKSVEKAER